MTREEARKIRQTTIESALRIYDQMHPDDQLREIDDRCSWVDGFVAATLPREVLHLAST